MKSHKDYNKYCGRAPKTLPCIWAFSSRGRRRFLKVIFFIAQQTQAGQRREGPQPMWCQDKYVGSQCSRKSSQRNVWCSEWCRSGLIASPTVRGTQVQSECSGSGRSWGLRRTAVRLHGLSLRFVSSSCIFWGDAIPKCLLTSQGHTELREIEGLLYLMQK